MKIHQLPMGARFEYEGIEYVKTGPMFANGPAGQRMIPKYAVLKPLDFVAPTLPEPSALLPRAAVLAAFDTFHAQCSALVPPDQREALDKARLVFLQSLDGQ